jgi:hypothetical protein
MEFKDKTIVCEACNDNFKFTATDQEFFNEGGYLPPKRCRACRESRKNPDISRQGYTGNPIMRPYPMRTRMK